MIFGDDEMDHWIGRQCVIYADPTVMFGRKPVGGIRVRAVEHPAPLNTPSPSAAPSPTPVPPQHHNVPAGHAAPPFNPDAHDNDWRNAQIPTQTGPAPNVGGPAPTDPPFLPEHG